ncbi:MFS transporter [Phreatobacter sp. AB_2022a]|uniref:MFS transporter n=1 Tax=Phreatobacter sp. AB_2022a TaxID=3003134 RepID=UPI00228759F0|nr:MFS transporter [Phreatobacter sp. AB_2022a]MCZ0738507.1 MFS transporter [Phreatobacter sp. AB_2022a]
MSIRVAVHPSRADKLLVLAAVCCAGLTMPLSFTAPSVALPAIGRNFGVSPAALGWVMNAFILAFGSTVMAAGALADRYGRRRMFTIGMTAFTATSAIVGYAPDLLSLELMRAAQGVAAAITMAGGAASLAHEFEGDARTRAYGLLGTSFGIGLALGPVWAGFLIETFGWRSVFLTGVAIGLLVLAFGVPRMGESRDPDATGIDSCGTATFTAMLVLFTFAIMEGPQRGWSSPAVVAALIASAVMLALFILVETLQRRPMLDLGLFAYPRFLGAQALPLATGFGFVVPLVILPARFVGVEGMGEIEVGLMLLPLCLPIAVVPLAGAFLARWIPSATLAAVGLTLAAAGLAWLAMVPPGAPRLAFIAPLMLIGIGSGLPWGLMDALAVSVVPKERAGMATGIFTTVRVAGEALALAATSAMLVAFTRSGLAAHGGGPHEEAALTRLANELAGGAFAGAARLAPDIGSVALTAVYGQAYRITLIVLALINLATAVVALATLRPQRPATRDAGRPCPAS